MNECDMTLTQHVTLGYSKTIENTSTGLTIGADRNNSTENMCNAQAYNTTQRIPIALELPHTTRIEPNTKLGTKTPV